MESGRGSKSVEKTRNKRRIEKNKTCWSAKHSAIGNEVIVTFTIIFKV
jgi:hypothetical protein